MPVAVRFPQNLRRLVDGQEIVDVRAGTVAGAIAEIEARYNGVQARVMDESGRVRGSVLVFVNEEDIRFLDAERTPLKDGDEVSIIPAFAGG
ncbi:MAG: MoaD/ThiS family protein [Verrucomicrobia bacterium]|nr:MoaD/ThiS family protein [Verrucomicrobiota bacterium]